MMNTISNLCCGCRLCEQICSRNAISMTYDNEGFLYPKIDVNLCINCGLCKIKCPQELLNLKHKKHKVYAAKIKDNEALANSTSGGIFWLIANKVLEQGGIVYGCALQHDYYAKQIRIDAVDKLKLLQGSKYVQSDTSNTYEQVKKDLLEGLFVVYSGTPCQIAGLKSYLSVEYNNLLLVDILCHGVPSPSLFKKYTEWLETKYKKPLISYNFRYKENGVGGRYLLRIDFGKKVYTKPIMLDPYGDAFLSGRTFRESCYHCKYTTVERVGDFSLGDYWKPELLNCPFEISKGVSMVLVNSEKAELFWNSIVNEVEYRETSFEQALAVSDAIKKSVERTAERDIILRNYENPDYFEKDLAVGLKLKLRLTSMIPISLKEKIKSLLGREI